MTSPPPEMIERATSYLRKRATELTIEETVSRVQTAVDATHAAAKAIPEARFATPSAEGEWSGEECLRHLVEWDLRNSQQILYVALSGELPPDEPVLLPDGREALIVRHQEAIDSLYAHVREAAPDGFLHITWDHPFFGSLNWREWFIFLELHNRDHNGQLGAIGVA